MPTVYFNSQACHISDLIDANVELTSEFSRVNGIGPSGRVYQGHAFTLDLSEPSAPSIITIINQQSIHERGWVMEAAASEDEELHREAEFWEKYLSEEALSGVLSLVGASNLVSNAKYQNLSNFHKALVRYENALIAIQKPVAANMPGAGPRHQRKAVARRDAIQAYDALISEHRIAINQLSPVIMRTRNRGNALSNANRGITLALRSRGRGRGRGRGRLKPDARIYIADMFQAQRLKKFTQFMARAATPLALTVDATLDQVLKGLDENDGSVVRLYAGTSASGQTKFYEIHDRPGSTSKVTVDRAGDEYEFYQ